MKFRTYVHTYAVSEKTLFSTNNPLILLMSAFFWKKSAFFGKSSIFTQSNSMRAVLEFFLSVFSFCKMKECC